MQIMEIKSWSIKNFMSFESAEVSVELGTTSIVGENKFDTFSTSNGSGKSSLVEGLIYGLYGNTSRGVKNDEVVNMLTGSDCLVEVNFEIKGEVYKVIRGRKPNILKVYKNGEEISGNTATKTNEVLETLLPINFDDFISQIYVSSTMPGKLSSLTPSARKTQLEYMANYDKELNATVERIKFYKGKIANEKAEVENDIRLNQKQIDMGNKEIEVLEIQRDEQNKKILETMEEEKLVNSYNEELTAQKELATKNLEKNNAELEVIRQESYSKFESELGYRTKISQGEVGIKNLTKDIQTRIRDIDRYKDEIEKLEAARCYTCGSKINEEKVNELKSNNSEKLLNLEKLNEIDKSTLEEVSKQLEINRNEQMKLQQELIGIKNRIKSLEDMATADYNILKKGLKQVANIVEIDYAPKLEKARESVNQALENLLATQPRQIELTRKDEVLAKVLNEISRGSFRNYLLTKSVQNFNKILASISSYLLGSEVTLDLDEKSVEISFKGKSYGLLSSGERRRVDVALEFSKRKFIELVTGSKLNIIILDEVFDGLDAKGMETLLGYISIDDIPTSYIISHRTDAPNFDNLIRVTKCEDGFSRIG